jgi:hypothetical protein
MIKKINIYAGKLKQVNTPDDIPVNKYMVYIFGMNGRAIVVGHGKKNRAKVICDDRDRLTATHIKSLFVRCCSIYGKGPFEKFIIPCDDKKSALKAERDIQDLIGGNVLRLPIKVEKQLFEGIKPGSMTDLVLRMAMASSFSGIADLLKWAHLGLLTADVKNIISQKLAINFPYQKKNNRRIGL